MSTHQIEGLTSWHDGAVKQQILDFVAAVSDPHSPYYVQPWKRVAVFDNDGTLWAEQPLYVQLEFACSRVRDLAVLHPEWPQQQPFQAALEHDIPTLLAQGERGMLDLVMATHGNNTTEEFAHIVSTWMETARHPETGRLYTEMVYQPMVELLAYLRKHEFKTYIISGGGVEFMRPWTARVYGIPPEQVIGSSVKTQFEWRGGKPVLVRLPVLEVINDRASKPVLIHRHIGQQPIAAFGNSDGDLEMLQWTTAGHGRRLGLLVHHTDAEREWAYDRQSAMGRLDRALDAAAVNGWLTVDMRRDWETVFPNRAED